VKSGEEWLRPK